MLSAAVCGQTFASPNSRQVSAALDRLDVGKGTLVVVKNYTGDVLQFGLAKERYAALHPGSDNIKFLVVGEDVAVGREQGAIVGRRGLAATVLVYKIAGALAAKGASLQEVYAIAQYVADNSVTVGVGLEHCHVPGNEASDSHLKKSEVEVGMGIHNEPGNKTTTFNSTSGLMSDLCSMLIDQKDQDRTFVKFSLDGKDNVVLLVNNLGGISELEMGVALKEAGLYLQSKKIAVKRAICGTFMTSLNMPGLSVTLVRLPTEAVKVDGVPITADSLLELLDARNEAPSWKNTAQAEPNFDVLSGKAEQPAKPKSSNTQKSGAKADEELFLAVLKSACESAIRAEPELTKYDTVLGDGDHGHTLKGGAEAVLKKLDTEITGDLAAAFLVISEVAEKDMGGTSGALYSIFFNGLAGAFANLPEDAKIDAKAWGKALEEALNKLYSYTRARPPSRTLVDPLSSFCLTFGLDPTDFNKAYQAAKEAQEATATMDAKAGRAAYIEKSKVQESNCYDAGATGVVRILDGVMAKLI